MSDFEQERLDAIADWQGAVGQDQSIDEFVPGSLGCHEALHMASFLTNAVDEELAGHPAILRNSEWYALARTAANALADLYQKIGGEHL